MALHNRSIDLSQVFPQIIWQDIVSSTDKAQSVGLFNANSDLQATFLYEERRHPTKKIDLTTNELTKLVSYIGISGDIDKDIKRRINELWANGLQYKDIGLFKAYIDGFDELGDFHREVEDVMLDQYPDTHFEVNQEEYLGYIPSKDLFVSEWTGGWDYENPDVFDREDRVIDEMMEMDSGSAVFYVYFEMDDGEVIETDKQIFKGGFYGPSRSDRGESGPPRARQ